jgi:hypothetical protein
MNALGVPAWMQLVALHASHGGDASLQRPGYLGSR